MKAKDYYEKYRDRLSTDAKDSEALCDLFCEMWNEVKVLADKRGVKTNAGFVACMREINDKWNSLSRLGPELYLVRDGFKTMCINTIGPEVEKYW